MHISDVVDGFDIDNIVPYFQPILNLADHSVISYECLARLVTSNDQMFLPSEFLTLVEKEQCFGELAQHIFHLSAQYFHDINMGWSINISEHDIQDQEFINFLVNHLEGYPNPQRVTLEVVAATAIKHRQAFLKFVEICQSLKIKVFLDRFAATSSNYRQILQLPIDGIKLDGALVKQFPTNQQAKDFAIHLLEQAKINHIQVIAEHIEDKATLMAVKALNVNYGQGYYFSHPQAEAEELEG
ncbi:EAL domain-containing protein [Neptunicella sp. SCSIO 80796]|uniref:EAL domain-containing protein n=1 Tax=Neptunicella plasticusilytica TaxID=3117012 RepID=UPI003A4E1A93